MSKAKHSEQEEKMEKTNCDCEQSCSCEESKCEECSCEENCKAEENVSEKQDYYNDLLRVQAEFDNYRKRMTTALSDARTDGFIDAIEQFLPALDSFKMATDMITDKNTLIHSIHAVIITII